MWQTVESLLCFYIVCAFAFDDIYPSAEASQEMIEQGRMQYQLLRDRGDLPKYGSCWKAAVEHLEEDCRNLSEETQSDIALHITNCFLEMSGHETYNCELNKKPNLRGICINSMSDRAFNVYTKFYTHTQHMCFFLRGQIWQETLTENTLRVGKQLEASARNQEDLIRTQKESLAMQEKMVEHGRFLGRIMEDLYISSEVHKEMLASLRSWLIGEISWFNTIVFYVSATILTLIVTSTPRTCSSRLSILCLLFLNFAMERLICSIWVSYSSYLETLNLYKNINASIWCCRYSFVMISFLLLSYRVYFFKDLVVENNKLLESVHKQNCKILDLLEALRNSSPLKLGRERLSLINESSTYKNKSDNHFDDSNDYLNGNSYNLKESKSYEHLNHSLSTIPEVTTTQKNGYESKLDSSNVTLDSSNVTLSFNCSQVSNGSSNVSELHRESRYAKVSSRSRISPLNDTSSYTRYNLRNRSMTPDLHKF